uniref:F-box domain-containing protein n=1 Tax=Parastrongyloides trichosuri TaxID=131310 RepID=A0A0N4ZSM5_PARTI
MLKIFRKESWKKVYGMKRKVSNSSMKEIPHKQRHSCYANIIPVDIKTFDDVSDKCIIEILQRMKIEDVLNMRLVNKRVNTIIKRHFNDFGYKKIEDIYLVGVSNENNLNYCYRLSKSTYMMENKVSKGYAVPMKDVHKVLKCISISNSLNMDKVIFSDDCYIMAHRLCERGISDLILNECMITMNFEKFVSLLKLFRFKNIEFKNCTLDDCQLISDDLFISNLQLKKFVFKQNRMNMDFIHVPLLSNRTLIAWANNASWPNTILLDGIKSNISYNGISALLEAFHLFSIYTSKQNWWLNEMKKVKHITWDFGYIRCQLSQILAVSRKYNLWIKYIKKESKQVAFTYRFSEKTIPLNFNVRIYT